MRRQDAPLGRARPVTPGPELFVPQRLAELRRLVLDMGALVEDQLRRATQALLEGERAQARHAMALDEDVDELELRINDACIEFLALHSPATAELRFVAAAMKAVTELERIGDQATAIAGRALDEPGSPALARSSGLTVMVALARSMVADALHAFAHGNSEAAGKVLERTEVFDALEQKIVRRLLAEATRDPALLREVFRLSYAARSLGRIAHHALALVRMIAHPHPLEGTERLPS